MFERFGADARALVELAQVEAELAVPGVQRVRAVELDGRSGAVAVDVDGLEGGHGPDAIHERPVNMG